MYNAEGSFARKQLEKHGWTEGSGLGSSQQGINQAIRVKIKHDTTGVGHDPVREFSYHWWDHAFNKAAASLIVENGEDGVVVKKKKTTQKERSETAKKNLYGNFIKSSLLSNGTETKMEKEGGDSDSSEDESQQKVQTLMLPDEELLRKCGGRTAHKGARHGLKLNGKLARIQEQERLLMAQNCDSSGSSPLTSQPSQNGAKDFASCAVEVPPETKRKKKSKKRGHEEKEDEHAESEVRVQVCAGEERDSPDQAEDAVSVSKKKKKKRKKEREENEVKVKKKRKMETADNGSEENDDNVESSSVCPATEEGVSKVKNEGENGSREKRKEKKKRKERNEKVKRQEETEESESENNSVNTESSSCPATEEDASEVKKKKKKSKTKLTDVHGDNCSDALATKREERCSDMSTVVLNGSGSHSSTDGKAKSKKSKKKKKSKGVE